MKEALRNPHRRRILELLASRKAMTPKEIAEELQIGTPTVYYHLEVLGEYVRKSGRGEFSATEKGLEAHRSGMAGAPSRSPLMQALYSAVSWLVARPSASVLVGAASSAVELTVCLGTGFVPILMAYIPVLDTISLLPPYFGLSVVGSFLALEAASYALSRRLGGEVPLLAGLLVSRLPLLLVFLLLLPGQDQPAATVAFTAAGQLVSVLLLSVFLSLSKGIRLEISVILCLALLYAGVVVTSAL